MKPQFCVMFVFTQFKAKVSKRTTYNKTVVCNPSLISHYSLYIIRQHRMYMSVSNIKTAELTETSFVV